jgi:hypothetical protein
MLMPDVDQFADHILGFDATPEQVAAAVAVIAELVRRLNHSTRAVTLTPQQVDQVVADLHRTVTMLPQLLQQFGFHLGQTAAHPRLAATGNRPAPEVAHLAARHLYATAERMFEAGDWLDATRQLTSKLYLDE